MCVPTSTSPQISRTVQTCGTLTDIALCAVACCAVLCRAAPAGPCVSRQAPPLRQQGPLRPVVHTSSGQLGTGRSGLRTGSWAATLWHGKYTLHVSQGSFFAVPFCLLLSLLASWLAHHVLGETKDNFCLHPADCMAALHLTGYHPSWRVCCVLAALKFPSFVAPSIIPLCVAPQSTRDDTIRAIRQLPPSFPEFMSPGLVDYISRALAKPADQRSSLSDLMRHPWILGHARCVEGHLQHGLLHAFVAYVFCMYFGLCACSHLPLCASGRLRC